MFMKVYVVAVLSALGIVSFASAIDAAPSYPGLPGEPRFGVVPPNVPWHHTRQTSGKRISQWDGSFVDPTGATVNFTMVGLDPARSNVATDIRVLIVPIRMVYGKQNGNMVFDPVKHIVGNTGKS